MKLYKKYISHVPSETSDNSFYLRPLPKRKGNIWYYRKVAGRETLGNVVKKVMGKAGFDGHFTNHSLRRSCVTNLYDNGVPEQVIQETTGHRSVEGVRVYTAVSRKVVGTRKCMRQFRKVTWDMINSFNRTEAI